MRIVVYKSYTYTVYRILYNEVFSRYQPGEVVQFSIKSYIEFFMSV
jgi:hypothetical protein